MGKKNYYFDKSVDDAIIEFQTCEDKNRREVLYRDTIFPAFQTMANFWYVRLPVAKNDETIYDCTSYLYEKINMFDSSKKKRGFAYFNMVARHWFFQKLKKEQRERATDFRSSVNLTLMNESDLSGEDQLVQESMESDLEDREFLIILKERLPIWRDKAKKEQEKKTIDALISIFEDVSDGNITNLKKKALFHYLREMTGMKSKQVASNLLKIKKRYKRLKSSYLRGEV